MPSMVASCREMENTTGSTGGERTTGLTRRWEWFLADPSCKGLGITALRRYCPSTSSSSPQEHTVTYRADKRRGLNHETEAEGEVCSTHMEIAGDSARLAA